jgi:protein-S-isoprenylcysteine O-methyltransferase Ste14
MKKNIKLALLTLLIYGLPIYIFSVFPFARKIYPNFESFQSPIFNFLSSGHLQYSSLGIIFDILLIYCVLILIKKESSIDLEKQRVFLIFSGLKKIFRAIFIDKLRNNAFVTKEEKVSLLFYLVKLFYAPLMIIFAIENSGSLLNILNRDNSWSIDGRNILNLYFPLYISAIFTLDTIIFSTGYLFESHKLKNVVKSVEPTALGWIFALACYGPFFDTFTRFAGPLPQDFADFNNMKLNIIAGFLTIVFFSIYVWASVALGFKASNLTNRGIVSSGPYKYVRHPAYIAKNLGWWVAIIPLIQTLGFTVVINLFIWTLVYFIRALTEERHLMQDPDYVEYAKKVKYMFIPGIF